MENFIQICTCAGFSYLDHRILRPKHPELFLSFQLLRQVSDRTPDFLIFLAGVKVPSVYRHPSNIYASSILGLKKIRFPLSVLIPAFVLLGNQVAESMTHPDARELSSLIINTHGSYELKKGCGERGER